MHDAPVEALQALLAELTAVLQRHYPHRRPVASAGTLPRPSHCRAPGGANLPQNIVPALITQ